MNTRPFIKNTFFRDNSTIMNLLSKYRIYKKSVTLRKYGHSLLQNLFETAKLYDKQIWIEYGTMLGAFREHSFIKHDFDIDCGMNISDYTMDFENELLSKGFYKVRAFYIVDLELNKEKLTEVTFDYFGLQIDIFLYETMNNCRYGYAYEDINVDYTTKKIFQVIKVSLPTVNGISLLPLDNNEYPAPKNAEELLRFYYGDSFMRPIPNYKSSHDGCHFYYYDINKYVGKLKGFRSLLERSLC